MSKDDKSPEQIEAEIEETREDLGDTVADIADKADVKKQAGKKADEVKEKVKSKAKETKETVTAKAKDAKAAATEKADALEGAAATDPKAGTGGDIGSGPTGDVRNSPGIVEDGPNTTALAAAAGAFVVGLALGWAIWR